MDEPLQCTAQEVEGAMSHREFSERGIEAKGGGGRLRLTRLTKFTKNGVGV